VGIGIGKICNFGKIMKYQHGNRAKKKNYLTFGLMAMTSEPLEYGM
jgi:hypothetical protein